MIAVLPNGRALPDDSVPENPFAPEQVAGFADESANLTGAGEPERLNLEMVSPAYFPILGVEPVRGRLLVESDEDRARPDARGPERVSMRSLRHEELAIGSPEEEVGIAARQQARGRGSRLGGANGRLVVREQPLVAEWRSDRQKRSFERRERGGRRASRDPCPPGEPVGGGRPEDVEVAPGELGPTDARVGREPGDRTCVLSTAAKKCKARDVYVYFDNDVKVRAPFDAAGLGKRLGMRKNAEPVPLHSESQPRRSRSSRTCAVSRRMPSSKAKRVWR